MEKTKTLEISSKEELQEQLGKEELSGTKSSLISCSASSEEMGGDGRKGIGGLLKAFAKKIVDAFEQVSGEDLALTEDLIQEHLAQYGF